MTLGKILLVEDKDKFAHPVQAILSDCGFLVQHATNADAAFKLYPPNSEPPDVIILDMNLGRGKNGIQVGQAFRKQFSGYPPEMIVCTAYNDRDYLRGAINLNVTAYLDKNEFDLTDNIVAYCRLLCLRRFFIFHQHKYEHIMGYICKEALTTEATFERLVSDFLVPMMIRYFGMGFVVFSLSKSGWKAGGPPPLDWLDLEKMKELCHAGTESNFDKAVVAPIYRCDDVHIALGVFDLSKDERMRVAKGSLPVASHLILELIIRHLRATLVERVFAPVHLRTKLEQHHRLQRRTMGQFLQYAGEYQNHMLQMARQSGELHKELPVLAELEEIGKEMTNFGKLIIPSMEVKLISHFKLSSLLGDLETDLEGAGALKSGRLTLVGDAELRTRRMSLYIAMRRVIAMFFARQSDNHLTLTLTTTGYSVILDIKDKSPAFTREECSALVEPFSDSASWSDMAPRLHFFVAASMVVVDLHGTLVALNQDGVKLRLTLPLLPIGGEA